MVFVCSPLGIRNIDKVGVMISFGGRIKINNSQTAPDYFALLSAEIASLIAASSLELLRYYTLSLLIATLATLWEILWSVRVCPFLVKLDNNFWMLDFTLILSWIIFDAFLFVPCSLYSSLCEIWMFLQYDFNNCIKKSYAVQNIYLVVVVGHTIFGRTFLG